VAQQDAIQELGKELSSAADEKIGQELVDRLKKRNYIRTRGIQAGFSERVQEVLGRLDEEEDAQGLTIKILGQECSRCDGLEWRN
jgi:hypothetical protein